MDEQHIHNEKPVQGQNIASIQQITQIFNSPQDTATSSTKPQRVWNIPYLRNDYFTGREEILAELYTRFKASNATAISQRHAMSGLGGIGKTQTAVEYAYRYQQEYQAVLWARAESYEALTSSFVEITALLDLPQKNEQDQTVIVQAVKRWLQDNTGWLLILDNADEPAIVRTFLPTRFAGHLLLTTRAQALGGLAQRIEVDTFTPELGALFLLRRATIIAADGALDDALQSDRKVALQISEELGGLPLALDQAGAYIEEVQCGLSDYLSLYRTRRAEVLKERGGLMDDHPDSVATTWSLSFQRVEEKNLAAADLLRLCAFLAPDAIPEEIITKGAEHLGPALQAARDPITLNKAIAALSAYSLIKRDATKKMLNIHRLVQAVLRDTLAKAEYSLWVERVIQFMAITFPDVRDIKNWPVCKYLLQHMLTCITWIKQTHIETNASAALLNNTAYYLDDQGLSREATPLYKEALVISQKVFGKQHPNTIANLNNLAWSYRCQGEYRKAEPLFKEALAISQEALGKWHQATATGLNNLADLYQKQMRYQEAEPLLKESLVISRKVLGDQHPNTIVSINNLAVLYTHQRKYEEAEQLFKEIQQVPRDQLPSIIQYLHTLATLYLEQGRYEEAVK